MRKNYTKLYLRTSFNSFTAHKNETFGRDQRRNQLHSYSTLDGTKSPCYRLK